MGNIPAMDNKVNLNPPYPIQSYIIKSLHKSERMRFKVIGKSMRPLIQRGDWVLIQQFSDSIQPKIGDIVLIKKSETFLVHRIIQMSNKFLITQGDWSRTIDPPNQPDDILGKVVMIEKKNFKINLMNPISHILNQMVFKLLKFINLVQKRKK